MQRKNISKKTFRTPFCREYWQLAFAEFKDTKMIVFAALILALRIVVKPLNIPIAADLKEGIGFVVNAFGSMIYGPVLALLNGALSDTLGYLLFPSGVYFPAYMITEMAGSFVFALFLYRAEITVPRLLLCRSRRGTAPTPPRSARSPPAPGRKAPKRRGRARRCPRRRASGCCPGGIPR